MEDRGNELIAKAIQLGAPFGAEARSQLGSELFRTDRAARSTDIVIFNKTDKEFRLFENQTETGGWSRGLLPPEKIGPFSSVVFGAQSHGFMTGATGCFAKYGTSGGKYSFWISTSNPYLGSVHTEEETSSGLRISKVLANGNNNIVHFTLYNHNK